MKIVKTEFGILDDKKVHLYILENDNGMTVKISDYGATITAISTPNKDGIVEEITCGFNTFDSYFSDAYLANSPYFGGTIGRYCSQIKDAKFTLNGSEYSLAPNGGKNNLHGGVTGFDKRIWKSEGDQTANAATLALTLKSGDMEEGFPGNVSVKVSFSLDNTNALKITYWAQSDKDTPFAMTNHTYFNLSGFSSNIEGHQVRVNSDKKQLWDDSGAATGKNVSVVGAPDDLRTPKLIKDVHDAMRDGFEHFYLFEEKGFELAEVAEISCSEKGRSMVVSTSEPGMLLYTGKYTSDELKRESGQRYGKYRGFCCETHRYPNGPNIDAPKAILKAGETFESTTIFAFKW